MQFIHDRQSACVYLNAALDPPEHAERSGKKTHPDQNTPLGNGLRLPTSIAKKQEGGDGQNERA